MHPKGNCTSLPLIHSSFATVYIHMEPPPSVLHRLLVPGNGRGAFGSRDRPVTEAATSYTLSPPPKRAKYFTVQQPKLITITHIILNYNTFWPYIYIDT